MFGMSLPEVLLVVVLALVVFGPERIPKVARTVGRFMREARRAAAEVKNTLDIEDVRRDLRARNLARQRSEPPGPPAPSPLITPPPATSAPAAAVATAPAAAVATAPAAAARVPAAGPAPQTAAEPAPELPVVRPPRGAVAVDDTPEREAALAREDARLERELRAYLGLPDAESPLRDVALPPRATPHGRLEEYLLADAAPPHATASLHKVLLPLGTRS